MNAQMQELQRSLQQSVDDVMGRFDKEHMRPAQKKTYLCCAGCFDSPSATDSQLSSCLQSCQEPVQYNQQIMQTEMDAFQTRLKRCAETCQDDAQQMVTPEMQHDVGKMDVVQNSLFNCTKKCVDKSLAQLPNIEKKVVSQLRK